MSTCSTSEHEYEITLDGKDYLVFGHVVRASWDPYRPDGGYEEPETYFVVHGSTDHDYDDAPVTWLQAHWRTPLVEALWDVLQAQDEARRERLADGGRW